MTNPPQRGEMPELPADLLAVLNTMPDGVITIDAEGIVISFNPGAEKIFGYRAEDVRGRNVRMLMPDPYRSQHDDYIRAYRDSRQAKIIGIGREVRAQRRDGTEFPIDLAVGEFALDGRQMFVGSIRDISERKRAESSLRAAYDSLEAQMETTRQTLDRLQQARSQLIEAERLASLGGLVAGIAHEIGTPLGVGVTAASTLMESTEALQKGLSAGQLKRATLESYLDDAAEIAEVLLRNLDRAAMLINSFKNVAVDQSSSRAREFQLQRYVEEIVMTLRPRLKKLPHLVEIDCDASIEMYTAAGALSQVLTNLIENSLVHAFDAGQTGTIRIRARQLDKDQVEIRYSDDGRGISPENQQRMFEPFFTTRAHSGGSGLGLHLVWELVTRDLRGSIRVDSAPGTGCTFTMLLPRWLDDSKS